MIQFIQLDNTHLQESSSRFFLIVHHKKYFHLMQHKVVCKLLLKVVCGSSVLPIILSQVSQSVRLTSALINNNYCEDSSIFCTASASFVSILGICSRHTRIGICDGRILAFCHACTEIDFCFIACLPVGRLKIRFVA